MARTRRSASTTKKTPAPASTASDQLTCPECGKTFARPAALGAHRRRAHGVAGSSTRTRARRPAGTRTRARADTAAVRRSQRTNGTRAIDRDALLRSLFPDGLPPREAVIRAANEWLEQAERLAMMK